MEDSYDEAAVSGGSDKSYGDYYADCVSPAEGDDHIYGGYSDEIAENQLPEYEEHKPKKRHVSFWKRPATKVYLDNFGFSVNGYQPMIDYLDEKDSGRTVSTDQIHLPYLEERCLDRYSASKPFKLYSNRDIDGLIDKGEKIRTQIRQNDAAGASNVLRRTHTNWSMTSKAVQLVKNSYVVDYRKLHSGTETDQDSFSTPSILGTVDRQPKSIVDTNCLRNNKYTEVSPRYIIAPDMESNSIIGTYILNKMDHQKDMADRRERLKIVDDQYEESVNKLAATVDRMSKRANLVTRVVTPQGNIYSTDEIQSVTDEVLLRNRMKRQQELASLSDEVDNMSSYRYRPRNAIQFLGDEVSGVNAMAIALARKNAIDAAVARETVDNYKAQHNFYGSSDRAINDKINDLRYQSRKLAIIDDLPDPTPRRRTVVVHDDVISPVQDRIMNRAREMRGNTSEIRRINNRAKYVNTITPRPNTGDTSLLIAPSKIERNVVHMSKSLAHGGNSVRKFDVDDEIDDHPNALSTHMIKTYCTREYDKPVPQITSDSHGVRQAVTRARERNSLLGN